MFIIYTTFGKRRLQINKILVQAIIVVFLVHGQPFHHYSRLILMRKWALYTLTRVQNSIHDWILFAYNLYYIKTSYI